MVQSGFSTRQEPQVATPITQQKIQKAVIEQADLLNKKVAAAEQQQARLKVLGKELETALIAGNAEKINIITADFEIATKYREGLEDDLGAQFAQLGAGLEGLDGAFESLKRLSPEEEAIIAAARQGIEDLKAAEKATQQKLEKAKNSFFWGRQGRVDKAKAELGEILVKLEPAAVKEVIEKATKAAEAMKRTRLKDASLEQSLDRLQTVTERAAQNVEGRLATLNESLEDVTDRRTTLEANKKEYAETAATSEVLKNQLSAELRNLNEQLSEQLDQTSPEAGGIQKSITDVTRRFQEAEAEFNTAFTLQQNTGRAIEFLRIDEQATLTAIALHKTWAKDLRENIQNRIVSFRAYLEIMKSSSDQKFASTVDTIGNVVDERATRSVAAYTTGMLAGMQEKIERIPGEMEALEQIGVEAAKAHENFQTGVADVKKRLSERRPTAGK
ncbi:hypothetical protein HYT05_02565 [Candidatus Kaiserbacteria bacterium]|nr:hypothetical protein [Candidatus Kaiserbacteria bacterium]